MNNNLNKKPFVRPREKGFTLIEMMVTITIFALVVGAISGLFISGIRNQLNALRQQKLINQTSYILEYMGRALRMAKKEMQDPPFCLSEKGLNYEVGSSGDSVKFINILENDDCQEFFLDSGGKLKQKKYIGAQEKDFDLTSSDFETTLFKVFVSGESQQDDLQPRITVFLDIKDTRFGFGVIPRIMLQTTVSQRNPDIEF